MNAVNNDEVWQHAGLIPNWWTELNLPFHIIVVVKKKYRRKIPSQNTQQHRDKDRAETQTKWQPQDEQDQTANSEQVGHCGLEKRAIHFSQSLAL